MNAVRSAGSARKSQVPSPLTPSKLNQARIQKKEKKSRSKRNKRPEDVHPAMIELKSCLVKFKGHIVATQYTALSKAYKDIVAELAERSVRYAQDIEKQKGIRQALLAPFGDELLEFRTSSSQEKDADGGKSQVQQVTLSARVARFEGKVKSGFSRLDKLWESWMSYQTETMAAAKELEVAMAEEDIMLKAMEQYAEELKSRVADKCREHVEACEKAEKGFDLQKAKQRSTLLKMTESLL